ncbi:MAG: DUF4442 domain-containing protein [Deltaproteobacteria bacterium]|nr:DUF4442 domain-containing protein [Deltaproteobacteria bacterium]
MSAQLKGPQLTRVLNLYPPYLGAGVRVRELGPRGYEASMAQRPWNSNYFGAHFGGSLYSMCDPFFALILMKNLGPGYAAWDKSATIRFRKPGQGRVTARFEVPEDRISEIRRQVDAHGKSEPVFTTQVLDERGELVAEVEKHVHVRKAR